MPKLELRVGTKTPIMGGTYEVVFHPPPEGTCPAARIEIGSVNHWQPVDLQVGKRELVKVVDKIFTIENLGDTALTIEYQVIKKTEKLAFPLIPPKITTDAKHTPVGGRHVPEALPEHIRARMELKEQRLNRANAHQGAARLVLNNLNRWNTGTLTVSFKGGNAELHRRIAEVAVEWSKYGNIQFDFGNTSPAGPYRQWTPNDSSHIRIGFDQPGYYSMIGTQSMDGSLMAAGEVSMNFQNFDLGLPFNWQRVVLHEFGHALGFEHEHQSPESSCDFRWDYIYQYYADTEGWTQATTDANMQRLINDHGQFTATPYDTNSIMHYWFPADFFISGRRSSCYVEEASELSDSDKMLMAQVYPFDEVVEFQRDIAHMPTLRALVTNDQLPEKDKEHYRNHMEFKARRMMAYLEKTCNGGYSKTEYASPAAPLTAEPAEK